MEGRRHLHGDSRRRRNMEFGLKRTSGPCRFFSLQQDSTCGPSEPARSAVSASGNQRWENHQVSPCLNVATIHVCFTRAREHTDRRRSTFHGQRSRSQSQRLRESLRQEADPRRVGELEADSSGGENRRTVAAERRK